MTTQRPGSLVETSFPTLLDGTGVGGASPAGEEGRDRGSHLGPHAYIDLAQLVIQSIFAYNFILILLKDETL